jgi:predicted nucleic acid-binding protein
MWLLDTMVISELRKRAPDQKVVAWLSSTPEKNLFISVVTISEIQRGIALQRKVDTPFAERLQEWLVILMRNYGDRLLPITPEIACRWGELSARAEVVRM